MISKAQLKRQNMAKLQTKGAIFEKSQILNKLKSSVDDPSFKIKLFVEELCNKNLLKDQIKTIQKFKGNLKEKIADSCVALETRLDGINFLLEFLLVPDLYPIRSSMDWIVDFISKIEDISKISLKGSIEKIFFYKWKELQNLRSSEKIAKFRRTFYMYSVIYKEYLDLDSDIISNSNHFKLSEEDFTFTYLSTMEEIASNCILWVGIQNKQSRLSEMSLETSEIFECIEECLRATMNMLKFKKKHYVDSENWKILAKKLQSISTWALNFDSINKETKMYASIIIMTIEYFMRLQNFLELTKATDELASDQDFYHSEMLQLLEFISKITEKLNSSNISSSRLILSSDFLDILKSSQIQVDCYLLKASFSTVESEILFDENILNKNSTFPKPLLIKIESYSSDKLDAKHSLMSGPIIDYILLVVNLETPHLKLAGLQLLESWTSKIQTMSYHERADEEIKHIRGTMIRVLTILISLWNHPFRQVNHCISPIFQQFISAIKSMFNADQRSIIWDKAISLSSQLPTQHRSKYQCLKMLIPEVGAKLFIKHQPNIINLLAEASAIRDISSPSSELIRTLLESLFQDISTEGIDSSGCKLQLLDLWVDPFLDSLLSSSPKRRIGAADYLLPELLNFHPESCLILLDHIRRRPENLTCRLWGMVNLVLYARIKGFPGEEITDEDFLQEKSFSRSISEKEIITGCLSEDVDLRLASLTALSSSIKTTTPFKKKDTVILKKTFYFSLKSAESEHIHKLMRVIRNILIRVRDSYQYFCHQWTKLSKKFEIEKIEEKKTVIQKNINDTNEIMTECVEMINWVKFEAFRNIYPGCPGDRETLSLEIIKCMITELKGNEKLFGLVNGPELSDILLNAFISNWDKSRKVSSLLINTLPSPLKGYENFSDLEKVIKKATYLAGSARLRESDAGALFIRTIFNHYCQNLKWEIFIENEDTSEKISTEKISVFLKVPAKDDQNLGDYHPSFKMIEQLLSFVENGNQKLTILFDKIELTGSLESCQTEEKVGPKLDFLLCHGFLLSINYCLQDLKTLDRADAQEIHAFKTLGSSILSTAISSLKIAMKVVAEASSDIHFAPIPSDSVDNYIDCEGQSTNSNLLTTKGPINSANMAASYINTNGVMGHTEGDDFDANRHGYENVVQKSVVAAWLLVKEAVYLISTLIEKCLSTYPNNYSHEDLFFKSVLSFEEISLAGEIILDALGRLKHMGAISEAQEALQSISTSLLRSKMPSLNQLPYKWLSHVLSRLDGSSQVFILRRSAGFAYSFLSLLRAQNSIQMNQYLPLTMKKLFSTIRNGLQSSFDAAINDSWKFSVHALNVLRLIITDSFLTMGTNEYIPTALFCAVDGFKSPQWAVRNSSMMVFTAVSQKSISPDKNSKGSSSASAAEYHSRFPSIFPFLLNELAQIIGFKSFDDIAASESQTEKILNRFYSSNQLNPALFPILLFISKLRPSSHISIGDSSNSNFKEFDFSLFHPVIDACLSSKFFQIRSIAAKAFCALQSIDSMPNSIEKTLSNLVSKMENLSIHQLLTTNRIHGDILLVLELLRTLNNSNENEINLDQSLISESDVFSLKQSLLSFIPKIDQYLNQNQRSCPPIQSAILAILKTSLNLFKDDSFEELIWCQSLATCEPHLLGYDSSKGTIDLLPFQPLLLKEAMEQIMLFSSKFSEDNSMVCQDKVYSKFRFDFKSILSMMQHPISELKEGLLLGFEKSLGSSFSPEIEKNALISDPKRLSDFTINLLKIIRAEKDMRIKSLMLGLIVRLIKVIPFTSLDEDSLHYLLNDAFTMLTSNILEVRGIEGSKVLKVNTIAQESLKILGWIVSYSFSQRTSHEALSKRFQQNWLNVLQWFSIIQLSSDESQSIQTRESALQSIELSEIFSSDWLLVLFNQNQVGLAEFEKESVSAILSFFLDLLFVLLNLVQDDDAHLRSLMSCMLSHSPYIEYFAARYDIEFARSFIYSEVFFYEVLYKVVVGSISFSVIFDWEILKSQLEKLWGFFFSSSGDISVIKEFFNASKIINNKVFASEKDNIYKEPILDALNSAKAIGLLLSDISFCSNSQDTCKNIKIKLSKWIKSVILADIEMQLSNLIQTLESLPIQDNFSDEISYRFTYSKLFLLHQLLLLQIPNKYNLPNSELQKLRSNVDRLDEIILKTFRSTTESADGIKSLLFRLKKEF